MAKTTAPLMSLKASGTIADTLTFFDWKGVNAVRTRVVPANPRSNAQVAQRGLLTDAVDEWHAAGYTDNDKSAWDRLAATLGRAMTGFNAMVKAYVDAFVEDPSAVWNHLANITVSNVTSSGFKVSVGTKTKADTLKLYYGTSPAFMPNVVSDTGSGDAVEFTLTGLTAYQDYYFYIAATATHKAERTGVYKQKTAS